MFERKLVDLGEVISNRKYSFVFRHSGERRGIIRMKASCGCVSLDMDINSGDISGYVKPSSVPYHLKGQGYYDSSKYITVQYEDGTQDVLILKMRIKDR